MAAIETQLVSEGSDQEASLDLALPRFRQAFIGISGLAPDELAGVIAKLPEETAREVRQSLSIIELTAAKLTPVIEEVAGFNSRVEHARRPLASEPQIIELKDVVVFMKQSKLQFDMGVREKTREEMLRDYVNENVDVDLILSAHEAHNNSVMRLREEFARAGTEDNLHFFDHLAPHEISSLMRRHKVIFALGGDDTAKAIMPYIDDQLLAILNSDAGHSTGALAYFKGPDFSSLCERLRSGNFLLEEWPRLAVTLETWKNGARTVTELPLVVSELGVYDERTRYTVRGTISQPNEETIRLKGSGTIFATGAGSAGWYSSSGKYIYPFGRVWPKTEPRAEFILREPYGIGIPDAKEVFTGVLQPGEEIVLVSSSNRNPVLDGESVWEVPFPRGARATIRLSDRPLTVLSKQVP